MAKIRAIEKPPREGTNVTLSDARAAFRDLKHEEARNPATGESIKIPAKKVLKFRLAKATKDAILGKK